MPIGPGSRLGPYEVTALIGEGGMGQGLASRAIVCFAESASELRPAMVSVNPPESDDPACRATVVATDL
jgi:hypothetical protein